MADRIEQNYLVARAIEENELAAVAVTKTAMVAHMQMASEYEERAGDLSAQPLDESGRDKADPSGGGFNRPAGLPKTSPR